MSMAIGDVLQFTLEGLVLGQQSLNVHFYQVTNDVVPPEGYTPYSWLCERFDLVVAAKQQGIMSNEALLNKVRVDNLSNGVDFYDLVIDRVGVVSSDCMPSFVAYNFILRRSSLETRNGSKRVAGVPEVWTDGNNFVGLTASLNGYEDGVSSPLKDASSVPVVLATPVIVGRTLNVPSNPNSGYHLDLTKLNTIQSAGFTAFSTQRSRKLGRGK